MKIKITLVEQKGTCPCHRGHKVGDTFDFDTERGKLCPMAAHVLFPMIDILRYAFEKTDGGKDESLSVMPTTATHGRKASWRKLRLSALKSSMHSRSSAEEQAIN